MVLRREIAQNQVKQRILRMLQEQLTADVSNSNLGVSENLGDGIMVHQKLMTRG